VAKRALTLWLIGDGKPGHENQSLGLAEAMQRRATCEIHRISIAGKGGIFGRIRAAFAQSAALPSPDFIIAAGHATHLPLLWLARKYSAKSIVLYFLSNASSFRGPEAKRIKAELKGMCK
jgi:mitochondrial fission protein ELM1